jgi:hypothetical protein
MESRFRINAPLVTHQVIDGEVIILNLDNGYYYSLADSAAIIWQSLNGAPLQDVVASVARFYDAASGEIEKQTTDFIGQLVQENLIVAVEEWPFEITTPETPSAKTSFKSPFLEKYTEMSDLLLVDPIHDVDEQGWPRTQEETLGKAISTS